MLGLLGLLLTVTTTAAGLPTRTQPAHPWEAAEPPTAETMRQLHEMLPQSPDEPMTEEETAASFDAFLRARGGRLEPMWANHSHAERTANLQRHHASRRSERRRAQVMVGAPLFADATAEEKDSSLVAVLEQPDSTCDDPLATNAGQPTPCTYDCADLQREYFPEPQSQTTRCFLFDPSTETWPEVGGEGAELLSMREQRFETHTYISVEDGTNPPPSGLSFTMGEGRVCRDVTIKTFMGMESHEETVCLVDGEHEYNHTVTEEHSVEVVGYAESGVHEGAGGTTSFVIGQCTDALIRVTTTSAGGGSMTWSLDDGGHNGPWTFETSGEVGVEVHESCMFDNEFTLTRQGGGGSRWEGSVEVVGFIHYHNTITIPNDENWIVQGIVDPASALPSSLDGRLKSGSAVDRSHANIVLRHLRMSGQVAPLDVNPIGRTGQAAGVPAVGGAFEYDGGSADPDDLVKLVFIEIVFDHNVAPGGAGGAMWVDGRAALPRVEPAVQNWESGIALTISACTFFRNFAFMAGALGVQEAWPLENTIDSTDLLHNDAVLFQHEVFRWSPHSGPTLRSGVASVRRTDSHYDGGFTSNGLFNYAVGAALWIDGAGPDEPDATWTATYEGCSFVDHASWWLAATVFGMVYPPLPDKLIRTEAEFVDSSITDTVILNTGDDNDSEFMNLLLGQGSWLIDRSRFERCGNFDESAVGGGGIECIPAAGGSIVPSVEFSSSAWEGNAAASGPALQVVYGNFALRFFRCVFRENVAYQAGGAILVQGPALSSLLVEESVFSSNAVRKSSTSASSMDVTVRLNTGSFNIGDNANGYNVPIWRIDDGPVYGIPYEQCQLASQPKTSDSWDAVHTGPQPGWPDLQCANVSYTGPASSFAHVVSLADGPHTLWTGLLVMTHHLNKGWQQAWIELVDTIGPLYPNPPETRPEQFPGCLFGACAEPVGSPACSLNCPPGVATWTSYEFRVSSGNGGAIVTSGPVPVSISDSVFRTNEAPNGASLSITAASSLRITNTTIDAPEDEESGAVHTVASAVATCAENPCEAGSKCTFRDFSTFCEPCGENEMGTDGVECSACSSGTQPDESHSQCLPCEPGQYSQIGLCSDCAAGKTSSDDFTVCAPCEPGTFRSAEESSCARCPAGSQPNSGRTACERCAGKNAFSSDGRECRDCPARNAPNEERTACFCQKNTYSAKQLGLVTCRGTSFRSDGMESDECAVCPWCLDCSVVGTTTLKRGWAFFGAGFPPWLAYRCPGSSKFEACPPLILNENTTMDRSTCAMGYEGPVCGNCEPEYNHLKVGNPCLPCDDGVINLPLVMGLAFGGLAAGGAIISGVMGVLQDNGVITDLRILVGFYQILGQASDVLDVALPSPVPDLVDYIKLLFLDVRRVVMLDCWDIGGFYGKIVTNIVVVPAFILGVCVLIYISQKRTLMAVIEAGAADVSALETLKVQLKQNLFVGIFLVYPTITTTLFRVPQCQYFGDSGFHEDDYTIDCGTTKFALTVALSAFIILLIPIGVPVAFLLLMLHAKQSIGGVVNETALGGAKLVADDADDESDTYGFLIKDYRPQYWYHEIVTYSRKLLLGGISVVMGRGTIAQTYFVITIEAFFQMHHMRTYPFVDHKHNVMEALGHCSLMLLYAISLILRNDDDGDWDAEWFPKKGYGWFIVFLFAIVLPSPTVYFYYDRADDSRQATSGKLGEAFEENPLAIEMDHSVEQDDGGSSETTTAKPARAKLAKMQRESKDARAQVQKLQAQVQQLEAQEQQRQVDVQELQEENQQMQEEIQELEAQSQMDGDAVRRSEAALRKEVAALKAQLATASQREGRELVAVSNASSAEPASADQAPAVLNTKESALKQLAVDESLSEEARDSAMKALEVLVASQLAEVEHEAATKKRNAELEELESEQNAAVKKRTAEQSAALEKLESESVFDEKKASAEQLKARAEAAAERKAAATERLQELDAETEAEMMEWLGRHRLSRHTDVIANVVGRDATPSDLQFLTDENIAEIGSMMTHIERMRLQAALRGLAEEGQDAAGTE